MSGYQIKSNYPFRRLGNVALFFAFLTTGFLHAQDITVFDPAQSITIAELRDHVYFLASDDLAGRSTGTEGFKTAAHYAAEAFREAGVEPILSDSGGVKTYFQPVPFQWRNNRDKSRLTIQTPKGEKTFFEDDDFNLNRFCISDFPGQAMPVVFVGYGIEEPGSGWNDYEHIGRLDGKIALMFLGTPHRNGKRILPDQLHYKYDTMRGYIHRYRALAKRNPVALLLALPDNASHYWNTFINPDYEISLFYEGGFSRKNHLLSVEGPPHNRMYIGQKAVKILFRGQDNAPEDIANHMDTTYKTFELKGVTVRYEKIASGKKIVSWNVVAMVEGTDPELKKEFISVGAHLDHLPEEGGLIFNGADDNASGVTGVLEIAEALVMKPPKRSVIFVLYTAEELGLFGSRHFVNQCPVPLENILVNINLDMIGRSNPENRETRDHYVYDADRIGTWLKNQIEKVNNRTMQWPLVFLTNGPSDHKNFLAKGIPSAFFFSGSHEDLHQSTDDADKIDYDKMQKISQLVYHLIIELANKDEAFYQTVRNRL